MKGNVRSTREQSEIAASQRLSLGCEVVIVSASLSVRKGVRWLAEVTQRPTMSWKEVDG